MIVKGSIKEFVQVSLFEILPDFLPYNLFQALSNLLQDVLTVTVDICCFVHRYIVLFSILHTDFKVFISNKQFQVQSWAA
jgi:hypothetical protein